MQVRFEGRVPLPVDDQVLRGITAKPMASEQMCAPCRIRAQIEQRGQIAGEGEVGSAPLDAGVCDRVG